MAINGNNSRRQSCPDGKKCPWCWRLPMPPSDYKRMLALEDTLDDIDTEDDLDE